MNRFCCHYFYFSDRDVWTGFVWRSTLREVHENS